MMKYIYKIKLGVLVYQSALSHDLTHVPTQHYSRLPEASENKAHPFIDCKVPVREELKKRKPPLTTGCCEPSPQDVGLTTPVSGTICRYHVQLSWLSWNSSAHTSGPWQPVL